MLALAASLVLIVESRSGERDQRLDLPGLATSAAGLLALIYALIEANQYGWNSPRILGLFAAGTVLLGAFVAVEWTGRRPMLDLRLFGSRTFSGANLAALLVSLAMFGIFFFVSLYMQNILGYTPVHTGVVFLPMTLLVVVSAPLAGKLTDLIGPRWPIVAGMILLAAGLFEFSRLGLGAGFVDLLPGMLVGGLGMGLAMGPMTTAALSTVSLDEAGVASGVVTTSRQVGGALGVAVMGAIVAAAATVPPTDPRYPLLFVDGFHHALEAAAVIALAGALLSAVLVRRGKARAGNRGRNEGLSEPRPADAAGENGAEQAYRDPDERLRGEPDVPTSVQQEPGVRLAGRDRNRTRLVPPCVVDGGHELLPPNRRHGHTSRTVSPASPAPSLASDDVAGGGEARRRDESGLHGPHDKQRCACAEDERADLEPDHRGACSRQRCEAASATRTPARRR